MPEVEERIRRYGSSLERASHSVVATEVLEPGTAPTRQRRGGPFAAGFVAAGVAVGLVVFSVVLLRGGDEDPTTFGLRAPLLNTAVVYVDGASLVRVDLGDRAERRVSLSDERGILGVERIDNHLIVQSQERTSDVYLVDLRLIEQPRRLGKGVVVLPSRRTGYLWLWDGNWEGVTRELSFDGEERRQIPAPPGFPYAEVAGGFLVEGDGGGLSVWSPSTGTETPVAPAEGIPHLAVLDVVADTVAWQPPGCAEAPGEVGFAAGVSCPIHFTNLATGNDRTTVESIGVVDAGALSPNATRFAALATSPEKVGSTPESLLVVDLATMTSRTLTAVNNRENARVPRSSLAWTLNSECVLWTVAGNELRANCIPNGEQMNLDITAEIFVSVPAP